MSEFEILLEKCRAALERYVRYHIADKSDADDVLQEVRLAAFMQFDKLRNKEQFRAWLIGIARNKCGDYFRSRRETLCIDELPERELIQSRYGFVEYLPVHETLELLSATDRQILTLFYFENMLQKDIASRLDIPLGTVKSRLSNARNNFKKRYPYPPKGEKDMFKLPEKMPDYRIIRSDESPFPVKWEELMGWFIVPRIGERLCWAMYDFPKKLRSGYVEMSVDCAAEVHGIKGVHITAKDYTPEYYDRNSAKEYTERNFVAQLTDTHCRLLAESHTSGGVRKYYTFLDGDSFLSNWGFGEDNCGNLTDLTAKGDITRDGSAVKSKNKPFLLDIVGRYTVEINGKVYDTVCVMDIETYDNGIASEQFIDKNGRTILWRRFNRNDWAIERYGKLWTEQLPENETITINGNTYVHWYDCITDYIF